MMSHSDDAKLYLATIILWSVTVLSVACTTEEPPPAGDVMDTTDDAVDAMADAATTDTDPGVDITDTDVDADDTGHDVDGGDTVDVNPCEQVEYESYNGRTCFEEMPIHCEFGVVACSYDPYAEGMNECQCEPLGGTSDRWVWRCQNYCNL